MAIAPFRYREKWYLWRSCISVKFGSVFRAHDINKLGGSSTRLAKKE